VLLQTVLFQILLCILLVAIALANVSTTIRLIDGFVLNHEQQHATERLSLLRIQRYQRTLFTNRPPVSTTKVVHKAVVDNDNETTTTTSTSNESKLTSLGYTTQEIHRSKQQKDERIKKEDLIVQVNLLPDIDSVTLTAIGFGLIAFNFFVLGNMEDGGIAGIVATIINTMSQ
jgi:hypothetical protein